MMKRNRTKWIAMLLCAALLCGVTQGGVAAAEDTTAEEELAVIVSEEMPEQVIAEEIAAPVAEEAGDGAVVEGMEQDSEVPETAVQDIPTEQTEEINGEAGATQEPPEEAGAAEAEPEATEKKAVEEDERPETPGEKAAEEEEESEEAAEAEEEEELATAKDITLEYQTHIQTYGWEKEWKKNGDMSGTQGQSKRLEGIQIRLSPSLEEIYDVYYCVHAQTYGWLGWAKNGEAAGTEGRSKRLEGIKIILCAKGSQAPEPVGEKSAPFVGSLFRYQTHVQTYGWQNWVNDMQASGTTGQSKRLEGIRIQINPNSMMGNYEGSVEYRTHVQTYGWETEWSRDGDMSGTQGQSKRLEGIQIRLTGELAEHFDIWYRVHAQTYGWLGWAKNGEPAGTEGMSKRLEAIQITAVPKGGAAPGSTFTPFRKPMSSYTVPFAQPSAGTRTIRNLLRTALVPCGRTLYQWGGGHGPDTNQQGMSQQWVNYFESHSTQSFEPDYNYISYWNGVDCSGYSSWVVANTTGNYAGSAVLAQNVAQLYSANKWTTLIGKGNRKFCPGDFVSVLYGHIWISLGQCSDGSVLLIHSSGNGIQLSGTGGKSMELARYYMQKYFSYWPYGVINYGWLLDEPSYTARWITNGSGLLTDPDGMQRMSAEQVMQALLGD